MFSEMFCTKFNTHVNTICSIALTLLHSETKIRSEPQNSTICIHLLHLHAKRSRAPPYCIGSHAFKNLSVFAFMEDDHKLMDALVSSSGASSTSRWNPTKEQISVLEGLYQQGLRTPSAEQIQQITSRLKVYGHIEGKNVFYWFQNHKARQRQKQKQESVVYLSRYLRNTAPVVPSCANVGCNPYCVPPPSLTFYPQLPKVLLPGNVKRRSREERTMDPTKEAGDYTFKPTNPASDCMDVDHDYDSGHETLELFPLRPTGIMEDKVVNSLSSPSSEANDLGSERGTAIEGCVCDQRFYNFFS